MSTREQRRVPPSQVDDLMLDVREADASGKSYGYWRIGLLLQKQKERERMEAEKERRKKEKNADGAPK